MTQQSRVDDVLKRVSAFEVKFSHLISKRDEDEKTLEVTRKNAKEIEADYKTLGETIEVFKRLITDLSSKSLGKLKDILSFGMQTIFPDRAYTLDIDIDDRGNDKTAEFILTEAMEDGGTRRCSIRDSVGGGIETMVSLILRVFFICQFGLRRALVLDEALSQISTEYSEGLLTLLASFRDDLGFDILFITHDNRFVDFADSVYRIKLGKLTKKHE